MTDISKCNGDNCPIKEKCYRFTASAEHLWQSYVSPGEEDEVETGKCPLFWDNQGDEG